MKSATIQFALLIGPVLCGVGLSKLSAQSSTNRIAEPLTQRDQAQQDQAQIEIRGVLKTGQMAIGGETTGTTISANGMTFELDLQDNAWLQRRAERLSNQVVWVTGRLTSRQTTERGLRLLVDTRRIRRAALATRNRGRSNRMTSDNVRSSQPDFELNELQWEQRPLLIFAPRIEDRAYQRQMAELDGAQTELDERDMVVIRVVGNHRGWVDQRSLREKTIENLRSRFDAGGGDFLVVLVGKDGTIKMRADAPIRLQEVLRRVDSMPMRRREIQDQRWRRQYLDSN